MPENIFRWTISGRILSDSARRIGLGLILLLVVACSTSEQSRQDPYGLAALVVDEAALAYKIVAAESQLTVRVYREGSLARLGHNHIISSAGLQGSVYLADPINKSALEVRLPLHTLEVDNPEQRLAAGEDFPGAVDSDAISGTRDNMLSERQLDATSYPEIIIRSRAVHGVLPDLLLRADIALKAGVYGLEIPVHLTPAGDSLVASGSFSVRQTELGLEPFSVMLGALRVRDQLDIEFRIVARPDN